jgi:acyl-CoA synthetase (NDP forming)
MSIDSLKPFLDPKSIAIVGASENPNKIGGRPLAYLQRFGFKGRIFPINPGRKEAQGIRCYAGLADLPETPEVAVIAIPGDGAVASVKECARLGIKSVVVISSGFGETSAPEGRIKQLDMVETARAHGMRLVGPNTQGLANFANGAVASFSTLFTTLPALDGPIAVASQSGAMSVVPVGLLRQMGLGVRYALATGNDADVTVAEMAAAAVSDPDIKLLLLYLESIPRPDQLAEVARIAHERGAYVVALKSGRTEAGQRAARSHTGALANEDRVVDAALERLGIWRAPDMASLVNAAELYLKGWKPKGRRLVAISGSGASCVMAADAATFAGLEIATLNADTRQALDKILPSFATTTNPIDLTAALLTNNRLLSDILPVIARDDAADAFMIGVPIAGEGYDVPTFAQDTAAFGEETRKPVVVTASQPEIATQFRAKAIPVFALEAEAMQALGQFVRHSELIERVRQRPIPRWKRPAPGKQAGRTLNEADSLGVLARAGLGVVPHMLCRTEAEAATAWRNLGGPVAVKGCTSDVTHKSDLGLVRLGLDDEDAIRTAYRQFEKSLADRGYCFDGVIVARMATGQREMMIGAHRDPIFGPVVVIGDGGKYVEAMPDVRLLLPPFEEADVVRALSTLRCAPILRGVRGEPPADVKAMARAAMRVAGLMDSAELKISSLDINPLIVGREGSGYAIVDAVVILDKGA